MADFFKKIADEGQMVRADVEGAIDRARALHHLASADPERDGTMTGAAHEQKYGLEREESSAALWRAVGVHPYENRALVDGEDGAENLRGIPAAEAAVAPAAPENAAVPKPSAPASA